MKAFRDSLIIDAPLADVFAFYTNIRNLARMVPPSLNMRVVKAELPLREGARVRFGVRPRGIPFEVTWDAKIIEFIPNKVFTDRQIRGPFDHWIHRHEFAEAKDGRTQITDTIEVGAPLGVFGTVMEKLLFSHQVNATFDHRRRILRAEFENSSR